MSKKVQFQTGEGKDVSFQAKIHKKMDKIHTKAAPDQVLVDSHKEREKDDGPDHPESELVTLRGVSHMDEQFPVDLNAYDDRDKLMQMKLQTQANMKDHPGITDFGVLQATDQDFEWLERKRAAQEIANLQKWFAKYYDRASPEQKALAHKLYPEFYQMREQLLNKMIKLQKRIAKLKIHGPRNQRDLLLQYAIESGYIPADPLENILHPERAAKQATAAKRRQNYARGLLNPNARARQDLAQRQYNAETLTGAKVDADTYRSGTKGHGFVSDYKTLLSQFRTLRMDNDPAFNRLRPGASVADPLVAAAQAAPQGGNQ
jgi:hypothetical protein